MINIAVAGHKGRMGGMITDLIKSSNDLTLVAAIDKEDVLDNFIDQADVLIDFTVPEAAAHHARIAARSKKPIVIGTTGLTEAMKLAIKEASRTIPIVFSPNMSVGVNLMFKLVELASQTLGRQFKVDIVETHHIHKVDKPSGTANRIVDIVCEKSERKIDRDVFFYEDALSKMPDDAEVSIRSVRRGEVIGDHAVHFTSPGETLSIIHNATSRNIFAEGALVAARWIVGKPAGLYGMQDVLGL